MVKVRRGARIRDVEYRGRARRAGGGLGGLPFPMPTSRRGRAGAGVGGAGLIGLVIVVVMAVLGGGGGGDTGLGGLGTGFDTGSGAATDGEVAPRNDFLGAIFTDIQDYWETTIQGYERATMVVFLDNVETGGCGFATSATGPFYCPADRHVYLDQAFFDELAGPRFGAGGDFAQAYVIAHEVGHHVQVLTGRSAQVREAQQAASSPTEANGWTIRLELQADCFAGNWASRASRRPADADVTLEPGDIEEGVRAAEVVGDDRIQQSAGQDITPHNWTHGSAEQRMAWFTLGLETGDPTRCEETFTQGGDPTRLMPG